MRVLAPLSSTNTSRAGGSAASCSCQHALFSATSGRFCSAACSVFFIGQPQSAQPQIDRRSPKRAVQARAQFGQRSVGLGEHQLLQTSLAPGGQQGLAPAQVGLRLKCAPLTELLAHPAHRRHAIARKLRNLAGAFAPFVKLQDALTYRHRDGLHMPPTLPHRPRPVKLHVSWKCSRSAENHLSPLCPFSHLCHAVTSLSRARISVSTRLGGASLESSLSFQSFVSCRHLPQPDEDFCQHQLGGASLESFLSFQLFVSCRHLPQPGEDFCQHQARRSIT